ncbi:MAG TPA: lactate utilization protein, partial [Magnetospirillaceae bacterium]|nr:lactate utilization protein [Magnetospirillaceae bacterium]
PCPKEVPMNPVETWHAEALGAQAVRALQKCGFDAVYVASAAEAAEKVMSFIKPGASVGFGGSMTVKGLGIQEKAKAVGATLLDHNAPGLAPEKKQEILRKQLTCDVFISGSNAVTLEGDLVNVDRNGNRLAALAFGPSKTIVVAGTNKIVPDVDSAFSRLERYSGPMNNKRLDQPNPCVKTGICEDCQGETRACRIYQILRRKPGYSDFTVIIVGENLGF